MFYVSEATLKDLNNYCKNRCQNIILDIDSTKIYYYRGRYKGYMYIIKLTHYLLLKNIKLRPNELYAFIKLQKNQIFNNYHKEQSFIQGILDSLYDCMNYISL